MKKLCINCRNLFEAARNVPNQSYCSEVLCQKERKKRWTSEKMASDSDYRNNQRKAQKSWQLMNPEYWKKYRELSSSRNQAKSKTELSTASTGEYVESLDVNSLELDGLFELRVLSKNRHVKIDVYIVEIRRHKALKKKGKNVKR